MKSKQRLNRRGHRYIRSFQLYQDTEAPGAVADLLKVGNHRAQSFVENLLESTSNLEKTIDEQNTGKLKIIK